MTTNEFFDLWANEIKTTILKPSTLHCYRVLTHEEETLLLEELKYTRLYPIVRFMLQTGLRVGEATALRFSDINMKDGTLLVVRTHVYMPDPSTHAMTDVFQEPKTKASTRMIPLLPDPVALLKNQMAVRSEETRKAANLGTLVNTIKMINSRLVDEGLAPIAPISCHALRHTFATRAFECGVKPKAVQKLLGHVSLQTTMDLYTHVTDDTLRSELMKMKKALHICILP